MEALDKLNDEYKKEFGKGIFTKEEIIESMKKTKENKEFNLYDSLMGRG